MIHQPPKIVVLTPVKNEVWILDRFLAITSQFADYIVIADQNSTDGSPDICKKYPKVILIKNNSEEYCEADRQLLLIKTARELVPEHKIILALDADEILAANALKTLGWQSMLAAKPGTILYFEKPDLFLTPYRCIRYTTPWPIGYVDDGIDHKPNKVHSIRIPRPDYATKLYINDVKILHYRLTRPGAEASKIRFYSVLENAFNSNNNFLSRRRRYASSIDWIAAGIPENSPLEWFAGWKKIGIDMTSIIDSKYHWWDFEVLRYFEKYGLKKFFLDDIWDSEFILDFDWEECRKYARSIGMNEIPDYEIKKPSKAFTLFVRLLTKVYLFLRDTSLTFK